MLTRQVRRSKAFTLIVVCIAVFSDTFTYGVLVPVIPFALTERLDIDEHDVQKWNSILLGVLGVTILAGSVMFGHLSDRLKSRRLPFMLGLVALGSATVLFALCRSLWLLLVARAFQGLSTAVVVSVGFALVFDKVGSEQLGQAMGYTSMSLSLGWFVGPIVGGIVYEHAGYLPVFAPPLVLIAIEIILRLLIIEGDGDATKGSTSEIRPSSEETPLLSNNAARAPHQNAMLTLLSSKRFVVGILGYCVLQGVMVAFDGVLPVFVNERYGFNSQQTSLAFLALTAPMFLSPFFGDLTDQIGSTKWLAFAGLILCVPGLLCLRLTGQGNTDDLVLLLCLLAAIGTAFAIGLPPLAAEVMHVVDEIERAQPGTFGANGASAQAYGLTNAGLGVGCVLGPMGAGFVRVRYGWSTAVTCMAVVSALTAMIVLPVTGGRLQCRRHRQNGINQATSSSQV